MLDIVAVLLVLTAAFAWLNRKFLHWPPTIGVMAIALLVSLGIVGLDRLGFTEPVRHELTLLASIDFTDVLMEGMLSVLLFAGALHVDLARLTRLARQIGLLAIVGTALSALIVGFGCQWVLGLVGHDLPLVHCLLFGALISPTDPVAVLGILESAHVPRDIESTIAGESLINDGVGVVLFALLLDMLHSGSPPTVREGIGLFVEEAVGGVALGFVLGFGVNAVLASIDDYRERIDLFWHLLDEILNSVLFVLIGLEFAVIRYTPGLTWAAVSAVILALLSRFLVVGLPVLCFPAWFQLPPRAGWLLTWSGIRGGISVALALSLPPGPERDTVLTLTYSVVVFSILVQGLSIGSLARRLGLSTA